MGGAEASVPIVKVTHEAPVSNKCSLCLSLCGVNVIQYSPEFSALVHD